MSEDWFERIKRTMEFHDKQIGLIANLRVEQAQEFDRRSEEFDKRFAKLTESQQHTDERLNILINVVERHFLKGANGRES